MFKFILVATKNNDEHPGSREEFLCRVAGLSFRDGGSVLQDRPGVEPLLLNIQKRWFRHLVWVDPGRLTGDVFQHVQLGRDPEEEPGQAGDCLWIGTV